MRADTLANENAQGLPGELLLVFTLLVFAIFLLVLLSNPRNRLNIWCCVSGLIFGIGVLKEYLFYGLGPQLIASGHWTEPFSETLYSMLSAVFYYLAMPPLLIFCYYFIRWNKKYSTARFLWLCVLAFQPAAVFALVVPVTRTLYYQTDVAFCLAVGIYDLCYGIVCTVLMVYTLWTERLSVRFRQRRKVVFSILLPLWFWLFSAFPYHALGIPGLSKAWQGNLFVVAILLFYFLFQMFREGIWGTRFQKETYDWTAGSKAFRNNARYVGHALKNELSKIEWCVSLLKNRGDSSHELDIIEHSTAHLRNFVQRTQIYSDDILVVSSDCSVDQIFREVIAELEAPSGENVQIQVTHCDREPLNCDKTHLTEALRNLVRNAVEALGGSGTVELSYHYFKSGRKAGISVKDDGSGIEKKEIRQLFEPYYTTKVTNRNLGLGLYYCWNVMEAHNGRVEVSSAAGIGSTFTLWFPVRKTRRRRREKHGDGKDSDSRG